MLSPSPHTVANKNHPALTLPACPWSAGLPVEVRVGERALDDAWSTRRDEPAFNEKRFVKCAQGHKVPGTGLTCKDTGNLHDCRDLSKKDVGSISSNFTRAMVGSTRCDFAFPLFAGGDLKQKNDR
jgi:hypothetical protein